MSNPLRDARHASAIGALLIVAGTIILACSNGSAASCAVGCGGTPLTGAPPFLPSGCTPGTDYVVGAYDGYCGGHAVFFLCSATSDGPGMWLSYACTGWTPGPIGLVEVSDAAATSTATPRLDASGTKRGTTTRGSDAGASTSCGAADARSTGDSD